MCDKNRKEKYERKTRGLVARFAFINRYDCKNTVYLGTLTSLTQMSETAKKIAAVTRSHEHFVLRRRLRFQLLCEQCDGEEEFVSLDDAVMFSGLGTREVVRRTETGGLHFLETSGGHIFVCSESLREAAI